MVSAISRYLIDFQVDRPFEAEVDQQRGHDLPEEVEDTSTLIREAEDRVREEERAALREKIDEVTTAERERADQLLASSREKWVREESERLSVEFADALRAMESELVARVARLLAPFLTERMSVRIMEELQNALVSLESSNGVSMTIRGSADLLSALKDRLGDRFSFAEFVADESAEIQVSSGDAVIETQFASWARRLAEAVEQD